MSSSEEDSKIDLLDSEADVKKKLKKAFCEPGVVEGNGLLAFSRHVIFPLTLETFNESAVIFDRRSDDGGPVSFASYEELEKFFVDQKLHPLDLKNGVAAFINRLLKPIREEFQSHELIDLTTKAYPPPPSKTAPPKQKNGAVVNGDGGASKKDKKEKKKQAKEKIPNGEAGHGDEKPTDMAV